MKTTCYECGKEKECKIVKMNLYCCSQNRYNIHEVFLCQKCKEKYDK